MPIKKMKAVVKKYKFVTMKFSKNDRIKEPLKVFLVTGMAVFDLHVVTMGSQEQRFKCALPRDVAHLPFNASAMF